MYDIFDPIRNLLKCESFPTDNNFFRLHYKATVLILITCSLLITQKQYFGDPIDCVMDNADVDYSGAIDTYCWIHSTYTVPKYVGGGVHSDEGVKLPGIGNKYSKNGEKLEIRNHRYYQWVVMFLWLQALMFYLPRYLWKSWEGGRMKMLVEGLDSPVVSEEEKQKRRKLLVDYFHQNMNQQNLYAFKYFFCEMLNFVNIIGQMYFTDAFLENGFTTYGSDILKYTDEDRGLQNHPMDNVFPTITKCDFNNFGASGSPQIYDALCVLPLNIFNQKIFIFLWFWFIFVACVTFVSLCYRLATVWREVRVAMLRVQNNLVSQKLAEHLVRKTGIGDWFILTNMAKSIHPLIYKEFFEELSKSLAM